jgi:hypothetical protein
VCILCAARTGHCPRTPPPVHVPCLERYLRSRLSARWPATPVTSLHSSLSKAGRGDQAGTCTFPSTLNADLVLLNDTESATQVILLRIILTCLHCPLHGTDKHVSAATDTHTTIEERCFLWSVQRNYNQDSWSNEFSWVLQGITLSLSWQFSCGVLPCGQRRDRRSWRISIDRSRC